MNAPAFFGAIRYLSSGSIFPLMTTLSHGEKIACAVCLGISATFALHLWFAHPHDGLVKKCFWSLVLMVPVLGWVFYGALYTPLAPSGDSPGPIFDGTSPENR